MRQYIHPMVYEDVVGNYAQMSNRYEDCKKMAQK